MINHLFFKFKSIDHDVILSKKRQKTQNKGYSPNNNNLLF